MYSIGLDISKSTINVYIPKNDMDLVIQNSLKEIKSLYSKLKKYYKKDIDKLVFIFEPTANYSSTLKYFCCENNIKCFIVNPKQSSNFLKAIGERSKSDITDARMLSKMINIASKNEIKIPEVNKTVEELNDLLSYYKLIIKQKLQLKNHLESVSVKPKTSIVIKELIKSIKKLEKQEKSIIKTLQDLIQSDEKLSTSYNNIKTIQGIGKISGLVLLHHFIKYPNANQREIVSLAGLDPIARQSGVTLKSKAKISKSGSKLCRSILYMAAMVATQRNEKIKDFYNRLKENGKATRLAQVAVMRKLIVIAHSLYKNNQVYNP